MTLGTLLDSPLGVCKCYCFGGLIGVSSTLNNIALETVHPLVVAGLIYFVGGVLLFGVHLSPLHRKILALFETPTETEAKISKKDYKNLALVILLP